MKYTIGWEKWETPDDLRLPLSVDYSGEEGIVGEDFEDDIGNDLLFSPVVHTPIGTIPKNHFMLPSKAFDCWWLYTNFNVGKTFCDKICKIPGIELCKVVGRYRLFVGIGKMFKLRDVRLNIKSILDEINLESENKSILDSEEIANLKKKLTEEEDRWAIFVFKDNTYDYFVFKNDEEYQHVIEELKKDNSITQVIEPVLEKKN